jgi:serine beta-lactamase-like protein LACTB, mitochondrial
MNTTRTFHRATLLLAVGVFFLPGPGQIHAQTLEDAVRESRAIVDRFMAAAPTPGLSIAVQLADNLVWAEAFGLANVEHGVPASTETLFRIGSISKALTSAAVGLLHQRGLLDLDESVQRYVPAYPEKEHPITTRQLGGHLSGVPHYSGQDFANFVSYASVTAALDKFKDRPLLFPPGTRFQYSSFGFNLISAVVEGAAGVPFLTFMQDEVFQPLGMRNTVADDYRRIIPNRTGFYQGGSQGNLGHAPFTDNSDVWAAGGFLSTPSDLVTFGSRLIRGDLLAPETLEILFTSMATADGEQTGFGLGWIVGPGGWIGGQNDKGEPMIHHGGAHFGASAYLLMLPERELVVAVTMNMSPSPAANFQPSFSEIVALFTALSPDQAVSAAPPSY